MPPKLSKIRAIAPPLRCANAGLLIREPDCTDAILLQQSPVATRVVFLLHVARTTIDLHREHLLLQVEIDEDVPVAVQGNLLDFT